MSITAPPRSERLGSLQALAAELERLDATKHDYVVSTPRMSFRTTLEVGIDGAPTASTSTLTFDNDEGGIDGGPITDHAHGQIRERLGIPGRYYDRMRQEAPALLDRNVRHWLYANHERRMVRMLDGNVRAFVSDRYRILDNIDLLIRSVLPELERYDGALTFHVAALNDRNMWVRALLPRLQAEITVGDVVQAGVEFRNSEVGNGALHVAPFLWRLACLNGMTMPDLSLRRYHVGRQQEAEAYAIYRDDTLDADDTAFFLKVRDAVGAALTEVQFQQAVDTLRAAATSEPIVDVVAATERVQKRHSLTDDETTRTLRHLAAGGDLSRWGTANAVTAAAKDADGFDRQADLEAIGGAIAAYSDREWAAIAAAR